MLLVWNLSWHNHSKVPLSFAKECRQQPVKTSHEEQKSRMPPSNRHHHHTYNWQDKRKRAAAAAAAVQQYLSEKGYCFVLFRVSSWWWSPNSGLHCAGNGGRAVQRLSTSDAAGLVLAQLLQVLSQITGSVWDESCLKMEQHILCSFIGFLQIASFYLGPGFHLSLVCTF